MAETDAAALAGTSGSGTPAGPPTAGPPTATPTRTATPPASSRSCTTASSRTSRRCATNWKPSGGVRQRHRHRGRGAPGRPRLPGGPTTAGDFVASVFAVLRRLEGHFTLVFAHADDPGTIVAARRSTPLVVGWGRRDVHRLRCRRFHRVHPRGRRTRTGPGRGDHRRRLPRIYDFDGNDAAGDARHFHIDWDLSAAEKGGYMTTSCSRRSPSSPPRSPTPPLGHFVDGRIVLDEQRLSDQELREVDKVFIVACGTAFHPGCWPSTPSSTGPGCPSRWRWPASSATATRCSTAAPW